MLTEKKKSLGEPLARRNVQSGYPVGIQAGVLSGSPSVGDGGVVVRMPSDGRHASALQRAASEDAAWDVFRASSRVRMDRRAPHEVVFHEDDAASCLYEIVSGQVMLYRLLADGRRQVVDLLSAGDLFGHCLTGIYDCSAETLTATELCVLDRRDIEQSGALMGHVNRCLMTRIEALHAHAVLLGRKSAIERVTSFLMGFVSGRGIVGCTGPEEGICDSRVVVLKMTRQEIADYLGLTIETVSRVLSELRRRGVITIEKNDRIRLVEVCRVCKLTGIH